MAIPLAPKKYNTKEDRSINRLHLPFGGSLLRGGLKKN